MARPNYEYEKRQRELAKKKKKEEKRQRKTEKADVERKEPSEGSPPVGGSVTTG